MTCKIWIGFHVLLLGTTNQECFFYSFYLLFLFLQPAHCLIISSCTGLNTQISWIIHLRPQLALFGLYLVPIVLLSDCRFVQNRPREYGCSQEKHIAPVCPLVESNDSCDAIACALNTVRMCSMEKYVTDGTHEVNPNTKQEGQSDFR